MLTTTRMKEIIFAIMDGDKPDAETLTADELRFWNTCAAEIAAMPLGSYVDIPAESEV